MNEVSNDLTWCNSCRLRLPRDVDIFLLALLLLLLNLLTIMLLMILTLVVVIRMMVVPGFPVVVMAMLLVMLTVLQFLLLVLIMLLVSVLPDVMFDSGSDGGVFCYAITTPCDNHLYRCIKKDAKYIKQFLPSI